MQGLYKREREEVFTPDGFYRTGDRGRIDADDDYFFDGRLGDMIKTGGANGSPREVEIVLANMAGVEQAHVAGVSDPEMGQIVVAGIVPSSPATPPDLDDLREQLRRELSAFKVPRHLLTLAAEEIPFTDSGKLHPGRLRELLAARVADSQESARQKAHASCRANSWPAIAPKRDFHVRMLGGIEPPERRPGMDISFTPEQDAWRQEVRDFLDAELPPDKAFDVEFDEDEELWAFSHAFTRKVGAKGWLGLNWPTEYGGLGRPPIDRMIMSEEFEYREAPLSGSIGWGLTAGSLLAGGTEEQKKYWLPRLGRMDLHVAEGLSETGAGSDLASLITSAKRDGDHWVLSGHKTYTTWGTHADWLLTAARSDLTATRHRGISMFLVPLDLPGVSMTPMLNLGGGRQNHTFLDDVRVPNEYMIGQEGGGWHMIMNAFYGGGIHAGHAYYERTFEEMLRYCKQTLRGGRPIFDDPLVRQQIGQLALMVEQLKMLTYESVSNYNNEKPPQFGGALGIVVSKELRPRFFELCNQIVGPLCQLQPGRFAPLGGQVEAWYRQSYANHAGGTSQVKRMVLATRGMGLPR